MSMGKFTKQDFKKITSRFPNKPLSEQIKIQKDVAYLKEDYSTYKFFKNLDGKLKHLVKVDDDYAFIIDSLIEELDAIKVYQHREMYAQEEKLKDLMQHNKEEEIQHQQLLITKLQKLDPVFEKYVLKYLLKAADIEQVQTSLVFNQEEKEEEDLVED